ncbi:hypothetical protein RXP17_29850, partial [Pseudomonas aeruginosa]|nr:hypothetical protein [Pseudomonas aeruginosa]
DWARYQLGFDTLEDIFIYATSTPFFCGKNFKLENLSHQNRTRNRKRVVFMKFLEWLQANSRYDKNFDFGHKKDWIEIIDGKWPIKEKIHEEYSKFAKNRELSKKLNGSLIMEWIPNLAGKELGAVLGAYKEGKGWMKFLEENSAEELRVDFMRYYD